MITASIRVHEDPDAIAEVFKAETDTRSDRASWRLHKHKDHVEFIIDAKDSTALRAVLNSITKLLTVYEKVHTI